MPETNPEVAALKLCKNCIYARLSHRSSFSWWECEHPQNLNGINLVDGNHNYYAKIEDLRSHTLITMAATCGQEGSWWTEKAKTYYPTGLETKLQTISLAKKPLNQTTLDDIL